MKIKPWYKSVKVRTAIIGVLAAIAFTLLGEQWVPVINAATALCMILIGSRAYQNRKRPCPPEDK